MFYFIFGNLLIFKSLSQSSKVGGGKGQIVEPIASYFVLETLKTTASFAIIANIIN